MHACCVRTSQGAVYSWGCGKNGQLGLGDDMNRVNPTLVEDESLADAHIVKVCLPGSLWHALLASSVAEANSVLMRCRWSQAQGTV